MTVNELRFKAACARGVRLPTTARTRRLISPLGPLGAGAVLLAGCALAPSLDPAAVSRPAPAAARPVTVFFATDRATGDPAVPAWSFGADRGEPAFGTARMVLDMPRPPDRQTRDPTSPSRSSRPAVRDTLVEVKSLDTDAWAAAVDTAAGAIPDRASLVYVHGFDTTFEEAVQDAARLKTGLGFDGPVVAFSWPSRGSVSAYIADETNARWAIPHLEGVLRLLGSRPRAGPVHLLAHSMGSRLLLDTLTRLHRVEKRRRWPFGEVVLLAPDLDREIFVRDTRPELGGIRSRISLYVSAQDPAMAASEVVNIYPRLGDARHGVTVVEGVETIDITPVARLSSAHAYFREHPAVLQDLRELVVERRDAGDRTALSRRETAEGVYWQLVPAKASDDGVDR